MAVYHMDVSETRIYLLRVKLESCWVFLSLESLTFSNYKERTNS